MENLPANGQGDFSVAGRPGTGSPEQFYAEICHKPSFRIETLEAEGKDQRRAADKANIERSIPFRLSIPVFTVDIPLAHIQKFFVQYIIVSILTVKEYFIRSD